MVCESRDTLEFKRENATETTATERQEPSSGCGFIGDRAGLAQQRTGGPCRATHETPRARLRESDPVRKRTR